MSDMKVRVYWNLHKDIWSVVYCKSGLVIDYVKYLTLLDAYFVVWLSGQNRAREEGKKNVHAFAVGYMSEFSLSTSEKLKFEFGMSRVKYNPFTDDYFMYGNDKDSWKYVSKDFVGTIQLESLHHENGVAPRVYI
tara:strand:+ start:355 stop:759 length:405 start_codon:yes stop_codon:yes gene_type:complete